VAERERAEVADDGWAGPLLDAVRGVRWPSRRRVAPGANGAHRSKRLGGAVEFTEYRPYRPGDDPRRIDWKLLARSDRAYIRLTDDHAVLPTTIVVDASASMAYPVDTLGKWRVARGVAVGLAAVAHGASDPVGVAVTSGEDVVTSVASTTRRGVVATIARVLAGVTPGSGRVAPGSAREAGPSVASGGGMRGRVVFVSDFLQGEAGVIDRVRTVVGSGGEAYAVHVVADEELEPPGRALLVSDPEDPSVRRPLIGETRRVYVDAFAAWRSALRAALTGAGASYAMVVASEPAERAVRRIVRL
jgi:uncharacterized protein (DUF58 family)